MNSPGLMSAPIITTTIMSSATSMSTSTIKSTTTMTTTTLSPIQGLTRTTTTQRRFPRTFSNDDYDFPTYEFTPEPHSMRTPFFFDFLEDLMSTTTTTTTIR